MWAQLYKVVLILDYKLCPPTHTHAHTHTHTHTEKNYRQTAQPYYGYSCNENSLSK